MSASSAALTTGDAMTGAHAERCNCPHRPRAKCVCSRSRPTASDADAASKRRASLLATRAGDRAAGAASPSAAEAPYRAASTSVATYGHAVRIVSSLPGNSLNTVRTSPTYLAVTVTNRSRLPVTSSMSRPGAAVPVQSAGPARCRCAALRKSPSTATSVTARSHPAGHGPLVPAARQSDRPSGPPGPSRPYQPPLAARPASQPARPTPPRALGWSSTGLASRTRPRSPRARVAAATAPPRPAADVSDRGRSVRRCR
jgi:hypothetical protein